MAGLEKPTAKMLKNRIVLDLERHPQAQSLASRGYGETREGKLELAPWEALYLLNEGSLEVEGGKGERLGFSQLLAKLSSADPNLWSKYLVFKDLRGRGYIAKPGFSSDLPFRVYERGAYKREPSKYLLLILREGEPLPLKRLEKALQTAKTAKKEVVLGLVERRGEIVYYSLSEFT